MEVGNREDIWSIGKESKHDLKLVAHSKEEEFKAICPNCKFWLDDWYNWYISKVQGTELIALCNECGKLVEMVDIKLEVMKK